jgi:monoamine oxidase
MDMMNFDVAVVGGGISGVYCAWRLIQAHPHWKIGLFELSDRIGGRLLSVIPPRMPHVRCELGGMRFTTKQRRIQALVEKKLRLKTRNFFGPQPENIAYLRRCHLRIRDLENPEKIPHTLTQTEKTIKDFRPEMLLKFAVDQLVPGATNTPNTDILKKLLQNFQFDEDKTYLYQHGFWNLLARSISSEAYRFIFDCSGYDTIGLNWNAVNTILLNLGDFGQQIQYKSVVDGYEAVPRTLCEQFESRAKDQDENIRGKVYFNHRLASADRHYNSREVQLKFELRSGAGTKLEVPEARARHLILAMPRRSLELVRGDVLRPTDAPEEKAMTRLIGSVTPVPLFKMFVCYPGPWWRAAGVNRGQSITDLPLRQCYYWAVEGEMRGADPLWSEQANRNSVLLATYDDSRYVRFWAGLTLEAEDGTDPEKYKVPGFSPDPEKDASQHDGLCWVIPKSERDKWNQHLASKAMAEEIHQQLKEMHGLKYAPEYFSAVYKDWGDDPFGGGANFWKIGVKSWEIIPKMIRPHTQLNVYVCGEAYSDNQGWVEGALETAEMVLQDQLGLAKPDWL